MFLIVIYVLLAVLMLVSMIRIYQKAGKPGWAVIVPIYNIIVLLEIVGKPWWWLFLFIVPVVNIVFAIWVYNLLSLSFGKDSGFTVGLILLPVIFIPILGLGSAEYKGPAAKS